jgi:hypothetical protein
LKDGSLPIEKTETFFEIAGSTHPVEEGESNEEAESIDKENVSFEFYHEIQESSQWLP